MLKFVFRAPPGPGDECVFIDTERDGRSVTLRSELQPDGTWVILVPEAKDPEPSVPWVDILAAWKAEGGGEVMLSLDEHGQPMMMTAWRDLRESAVVLPLTPEDDIAERVEFLINGCRQHVRDSLLGKRGLS